MFRIDFDDAEIDGDCSAAMPSSRRGSRPRGWLRAGSRAAWRIASRAAEGSDQSTSRLRRARQNHRSCVLAGRLRLLARHLHRSPWRVHDHGRGSIGHATKHGEVKSAGAGGRLRRHHSSSH